MTTSPQPWKGVKWFQPEQSFGETISHIALGFFIVGLVGGLVFFGMRAVL